MALAKVKLGSSGGKNKERWLTRAECKEGSSKRRRRADRALAGRETADAMLVSSHKKEGGDMPRQELIFLKNWSKRGYAMKAAPVPCAEKPTRIWTLFREETESKPPALPIIPVHMENAFLEDHVHDWNWHGKLGPRPAQLDYYSRVSDRPVWILLEYDTAAERAGGRRS